MIGFDSLTGGGGLSVASNPTATAGPVSVGGFTFAPKSYAMPPAAWAALAAVALVGVLVLFKR